jgi:hypothetical protein
LTGGEEEAERTMGVGDDMEAERIYRVEQEEEEEEDKEKERRRRGEGEEKK